MAFYLNVGYSFQTGVQPEGGLILSSAMPSYQLTGKRNIERRYPYLRNRLLDPQLYLSNLSGNRSEKQCVNLASYPWFCARNIEPYNSNETRLNHWKNITKEKIMDIWPGNAPSIPSEIDDAVKSCIDFQINFGCSSIILPSPLTVSINNSYDFELNWLDRGLEYYESINESRPIYATIAIRDLCLSQQIPNENRLLKIILDQLSSRPINGVYLVIDQASENDSSRYMSDEDSILSALYLVNTFKQDSDKKVIVNFFGPFGLVFRAIGADIWVSNWYKSLVRFRFADQIGFGRVYPLYWSFPAATDIHLDSEFDKLIFNGLLQTIADNTDASLGLLMAAENNISVKDVPDWRYSISNRTYAIDHYQQSMINAEKKLARLPESQQIDFIENWLQKAVQVRAKIIEVLDINSNTKLSHIRSWQHAFRKFRLDQNL